LTGLLDPAIRSCQEKRLYETPESVETPTAQIPPPWLSEWLPEIVLVLVTAGAGIWAAGRWVDPCGDPSYAWSYAYRISLGERLYRDIYTQYTPLSPYALAVGAKLFGATPNYFLFAYWIPAILAAVLALRCGRAFLTAFERLALAGMIIATSLFLPGPGHLVFPYYPGAVHALLLSMAALLCISSETDLLPRRVFWSGCLAALAFACKQEIGVAVLAGLALALGARRGRPLPALARLLGGFLAISLPVALFAWTSAPYDSLVHDNHLWPLSAPPSTTMHLLALTSGLGRPLWLLAVAKRIALGSGAFAALAIIAMLAARERERIPWLRVAALSTAAILAWLATRRAPIPPLPPLALSTFVAVLVAAAALLLRDLPGRPFLTGLAAFAGLIGLRNAFSPNVTGPYAGPAHLVSALTSLIAVLVLAPRCALGRTRAAGDLRTILGILLFGFCWWHAAISIGFLRHRESVPVETPAGRVFAAPGRRDLLEAIGRVSTPGERVLVLPESFGIDVLFRLREVSPLPWATPGWLDDRIETQLLRRVEGSPPDLVVLIRREFKEYQSEPLGVGYGLALWEWCSRNYRVVASLPAGRVLRRR
jgi:hypothetical protein